MRVFYEFDTLIVGESRLYLGADPNKLKSAASIAGKRYGRVFRTKKTEHGVEVWREK